MRRVATRLSKAVTQLEELCLAWGILGIAALTIGNVIARTFFGTSLAFAEEISQFLIVLVIFLVIVVRLAVLNVVFDGEAETEDRSGINAAVCDGYDLDRARQVLSHRCFGPGISQQRRKNPSAFFNRPGAGRIRWSHDVAPSLWPFKCRIHLCIAPSKCSLACLARRLPCLACSIACFRQPGSKLL